MGSSYSTNSKALWLLSSTFQIRVLIAILHTSCTPQLRFQFELYQTVALFLPPFLNLSRLHGSETRCQTRRDLKTQCFSWRLCPCLLRWTSKISAQSLSRYSTPTTLTFYSVPTTCHARSTKTSLIRFRCKWCNRDRWSWWDSNNKHKRCSSKTSKMLHQLQLNKLHPKKMDDCRKYLTCQFSKFEIS